MSTSVSLTWPASEIGFSSGICKPFLVDIAVGVAAQAAADIRQVRYQRREGHQPAAENIGMTVLTSWIWPAHHQGSLVIKQRVAGLERIWRILARRKCFTVAGRLPMKEGMLGVDWASERPCASVSTTAKSLASRTSVEKQVRTKAVDDPRRRC